MHLRRAPILWFLLLVALVGGAAADDVPSEAPSVRVVFVSQEPPSARQRTAIQNNLDAAQAAIAEASNGALRIRFGDLEHLPHRVASMQGDTAYAEVLRAIAPAPGERVLAFAAQQRFPMGMAARPLTVEALQQGAVAVVWRRAWDGVNVTYRIALHELLHTLGAVHAEAPGSDGRGHSRHDGDLMKGYGRMECPGRAWRAVDCRRDSYFSLDPEPGSWLYENPQWNVARSPFLEPVPAADGAVR